jgi:hypothetical protein
LLLLPVLQASKQHAPFCHSPPGQRSKGAAVLLLLALVLPLPPPSPIYDLQTP